jgi:hypothetical protein
VLKVIEPIWATTTETANRVRGRIERVLYYAKVLKLRDGENPAAWRGNIAEVLPKRSKIAPIKHQPCHAVQTRVGLHRPVAGQEKRYRARPRVHDPDGSAHERT